MLELVAFLLGAYVRARMPASAGGRGGGGLGVCAGVAHLKGDNDRRVLSSES